VKAFPRWLQALVSIAALGLVLLMASRFSEKAPIYAEGTISIAPEVLAQAGEHRKLFIVVFDQNNPGPMPYGALRVQLSEPAEGNFHHFILTRENLSVMAGKQTGQLEKMRIKARLSTTGFIGQNNQGDLYGEVADIALGSSGVEIIIDKIAE
jgi:hypothetical protein